MPVNTTYVCDRCGHSQDKDEQMWNVGIFYGHVRQSASMQKPSLWCRKCCDELQIILTPKAAASEPPPVVLTLEDKIREIVREEMEYAR